MEKINKVESFWNINPCGLPKSDSHVESGELFEPTERERYEKQAGILNYADFKSFRGKKVLEIGCGIGVDGSRFAGSGAIYTGVDLTEAGVKVTKERFAYFGLKGEILQVNAEKLPFADSYFDHIYSFGVIHHSPNPELIVKEIERVLKPNGTVTIMLYNRTSFYYQIEVRFIRKIFFYFCDKAWFWKPVFRLFGKKLFCRFEGYREKLERMKKVNNSPDEFEWISMNTDDVFCPIARVYSASEAKELFAGFRDFRTSSWFIDKDNWLLWHVFGWMIPKPLEQWLGSRFGWFRMIQARK